MTKKKVQKKPSAKEEKQAEDNNKIFDSNGKLIIQTKQEDEIKTKEPQIDETKKKPTNVKTISDEEAQDLKRAYWRAYYKKNSNKYKTWNKNWRLKNQKKNKRETT